MAIKINVNQEMIGSPFSFEIESKELEVVLVKAKAALESSPSGARSFLMVASKSGAVTVAALGGDTQAVLALKNAKATAPGVFCFEAERVLGLIKNRSRMVFKFTGQSCEFKQVKGSYSGTIVVLPVTASMLSVLMSKFSKAAMQERDHTTELSTETLNMIKEGLDLTNIKNVYQQQTEGEATYLGHVTLKKKRLSISTFDGYHFGLYKSKTQHIGGDFTLACPIAHFQLIDKLLVGFDSSDVKVSLGETTITMITDDFTIVLPLYQTAESNFEMIPRFMEEQKKFDLSCTLEFSALNTVVENLFALNDPDTKFTFEHKSGTNTLKIALVADSSPNSASDVISVSADKSNTFSAVVSPKLFKDMLSLVRLTKQIAMSIKSDKCILFKGTSKLGAEVNYVCTLDT